MKSKRKLKSLRLKQTRDLSKEYEENNLQFLGPYRFIKQMESKLGRDKSVSKKQRDWLDSLIDQGLPSCNDPSTCERIKRALGLAELNWHHSVLTSFYSKAWEGSRFTEKQKSYLEELLNKADDILSGDFWMPETSHIEDAKVCLVLAKSFDTMWVSSHPGFAIAWKEVREFVDGERRSITQKRWLQFMGWTSKKFDNFKNPRFAAGSLAYLRKHDYWQFATGSYRMSNNNEEWGKLPESIFSVVTSDAYITDDGQVVNDVLVEGKVLTIPQDILKKRR